MQYNTFWKQLFSLSRVMLLLAIVQLPLRAAVVSMQWQGTVSNVTSFSPNALPVGVSIGVPISGSLVFDSSQNTGAGEILGSSEAGEQYHYADSLIQTMDIGELEWRIRGADVALVDYSGGYQSVGAFSSSDKSNIELFPNYVGYVEAGFGISGGNSSSPLFDSFDVGSIDLNQFANGSGSFSTRLWDQPNGNIVDGYSVDFTINSISPTPAPEPSCSLYLVGSLSIFINGIRKRPWSGK